MKWIIVTGDSGGVGYAVAECLLKKENYGVIGISRHTNEAVASHLRKYPDKYHHFDYDLSNPESIKALYHKTIKPIGPIYGLVNNAAFAYSDLLTNAVSEEIEKMFKVNVIVPMMLTKYAIRDMLLNGIKGSIVHVSSVSSSNGYKGLAMYAATKGALESFSRSVAREWGSKGIRSNCIAPGFMETNMSQTLTVDQKDRIYRRTALGHQTDVHSVAETIAFLLSDVSASITGAVVHVDNGQN